VNSERSPLVAIVGNPNAGKTTLFNSLTGSKQKVANYPGVTVERVSAILDLGSSNVECVDIPGLYSLEAQSADEQVAVDAIFGKGIDAKPDLVVCVMNAANLERNLYLFSQLADSELPVVVALTMTDVLRSEGKDFELGKLADLLGVDVVPVVGHKGEGVRNLKEAIARNLELPRTPSREFGFPLPLETKVALLRERLARAGLDVARRDVRMALLGEQNDFAQSVAEIPEIAAEFEQAKLELEQAGVGGPPTIEVSNRYQWAGMVGAATIRPIGAPRLSVSEKIDRVLTHRVFGLAIFVAVMYVVFQSIYSFANPLMDQIEVGQGWLGERVGGWLENVPILQSLVVDGIIGGIGSVVVFLPQILILFLFIALLEGTGYLARAAFLMDRLLGWCGLNGRAFIPLLSSFACAIPGIMAARVMPDPKSRLATILVAPLMSCSARLPVYVLLIGAIIEPQFGAAWAGFTLFAMHFLGLALAVPIVLILNRGIIKGHRLPFLLELPPYQLPKWRDVWLAMYFRGKVFLTTAGTIIFAMSVIIWALSYFPRSAEADAGYRQTHQRIAAGVDKDGSALPPELIARYKGTSEDDFVDEHRLRSSFLGRAGLAIEPIFRPAGFDWRISTAILCAFPAREVVVSSMGVLFAVGDADEKSGKLRSAVQKAKWPDGKPLLTPWTAVGLMVFFALCAQCMSTLATVRRETNSWKWPWFMFFYMSGLAYLAAVGIHQVGLWLGH
jgi:ferrous iron transport protein B